MGGTKTLVNLAACSGSNKRRGKEPSPQCERETAGLQNRRRGGISQGMARWQHAPLFRGRHFADDVITMAVRWYSRYSLSFRELEEMLQERNIKVDHTTLWHWVQRYAPELDKRLRPHLRPTGKRWHLDET